MSMRVGGRLKAQHLIEQTFALVGSINMDCRAKVRCAVRPTVTRPSSDIGGGKMMRSGSSARSGGGSNVAPVLPGRVQRQ